MSGDSPSSTNDSRLNPDISSEMFCLISTPYKLIHLSYYFIFAVFLLPLCILVLYLGLHRWRQQRSTSSIAATMSHSDSFTYHVVTIELTAVVGAVLCSCAICVDNVNMLQAGYRVFSMSWFGETFFHLLICVERYLAVVHPIVYLSLRGERGVTIRHITIGCVWLFIFLGTPSVFFQKAFLILNFCILISSLIIIIFCDLSVLHVLIRPGPREQAGDRERVDKLKQRAFYTITVLLGVVCLRCVLNLVWVISQLAEHTDCVMVASEIWFNLPCSLVLPLLFLHRAGKFTCCKKDVK